VKEAKMKTIKLLAKALLVFGASVTLAQASDSTAAYAQVDKSRAGTERGLARDNPRLGRVLNG
jgi:hypothetical protein